MNRLPSSKKTAYLLTALLGLILVFSLTYILLFAGLSVKESRPKIARIYQGGELLFTISLSEVTESYSVPILGKQGEYNLIQVRPDGICVLEADCPDQLCVRQGILKDSLLPITCLPNRLVIRIEELHDDGVDGITY